MSEPADRRPTVAIIGGGFTGAAIAYHFARNGGDARLIVIEPRGALGGGLAYSAEEPACRINVPAAKMSLDPEEPEDFVRWLIETDSIADDPAASLEDGRVFPQRAVFGRYVAGRVAPFLASGAVEHRRTRALAAERRGGGFLIRLDDGGGIEADRLILAVSHPPPVPPARLLAAFAGAPKFVIDTTAPGALDEVGRQDDVLLVGIGLTGADVIASLDRLGHRGRITAISRRGLRPKGHASVTQEAFGDFVAQPETRTLELFRRIRREVSAAADRGLTWHPVFDALRSQGPAIWEALPLDERRRLVRHLRAIWDVHRFRIAPQVEAAIDRRLAEGSLELFAASITGAAHRNDAFEVTLRRRQGGASEVRRFDAVLIATGPAHGAILSTDSLLADLARAGLLQPDPTALGIATDRDGHAIGADGRSVPDLLIGGPLARGTFGELMGLPEVAAYAKAIAADIARGL